MTFTMLVAQKITGKYYTDTVHLRIFGDCARSAVFELCAIIALVAAFTVLSGTETKKFQCSFKT